MNNELIIYRKPKSSTAEAIRTLRTNLQFSLIDENQNIVMVTSSIPGEGKSFLSANLSIAFSMVNKKTLIIDCDLRRGRQTKMFNVSVEDGLSNLLLDDIKNYKKYIVETDIENLSVISNGTVPPNPSELLGSHKFKTLLSKLRKEFDLIILDCPPVSAVTDALILSALADKIVLVCAYKKTPIGLLEETKKALGNASEKIAGVVVNRVKDKRSKYYYNDRYYQ